MRTFKILLLLVMLSFQASATGYVHNMFVAHKKLQSGKETPTERMIARKARPAFHHKHAVKVQVKQAAAQKQMSSSATLNERMLEEGPWAFLTSEENEENENTMISKLVDMMRCVVQAFIPQLRNS